MTWVQNFGYAVCAWVSMVACAAATGADASATHTQRNRPAALSNAIFPPTQGPAVLHISGRITRRNTPSEAVLDMAMLSSLPQYEIRTPSPWFKDETTFSGPLLQDVLTLVGAQGEQLRITALNDYAVDVPVSDARQYQPILAWKRNGLPMSVRDKGPLFLIYPYKDYPELRNDIYYGRAIWQIRSIAVQALQP